MRSIQLESTDFEAIRSQLPQLAYHLTTDSAPTQPLLQQFLCQYNFPALNDPQTALRVGQFEVDNRVICSYYWVPDRCRGTTFLVHGYFDHVGLYGHLIEHLLSCGQAVVAFDLPGHGLSDGEPLAIDHFRSYQQVLECLLDKCQHFPKPFHGVGQSTGGAVLLGLLQQLHSEGRSTPAFERTYLLAPLVRPWQWRRKLLKFWLLRWLVSSAPREFAVNSHDRDFLRFLEKGEPLQQRHIPLSWVRAMVRWGRDFAGPAPCRWPITVVQGDCDTTVDGPYNIKRIQQQFPQAGVHIVEGAMHHMVNEREDIRARILKLIDL
ncbi:alpha/beta hydrolase [Porticoccus sp. W117]|uniref:alpha/beta hydrolase n=1 Tax=Porticoccus sp. W117 TaxID=3054777 RepID=UPI0025966962|nr:alpha/beta hydrolase [Porticoccus sp. W117]MDM3870858.1 alpha/beta hydrolase [Porticoccus sp. W117]